MTRHLDPVLGPLGYERDEAFGTELRHWRAALANVKLGVGKARVLVVGDSICEGQGPANETDRLVYKFRQAIQQIWRPGGEGYVAGYRGAFIANRWVLANSPTLTDFGYGIGRRAVLFTGATQTATLTFSGDRFQIFYSQTPTAGNLKVVVDGGAPILFSTNGTPDRCSRIWDSFTNGGLTLTRGSHTIVVSADNTLAGHAVYSALLEGAMIYDNDFASGIQVLNGSHSAYSTAEFFHSTVSNAINLWASGMDNVLPDLVVIELGLNDLGLGSLAAPGIPIAPSVMKTNLVGIVTNIVNNGTINTPLGYTPSVVLVPLWARSDTFGPFATGSIASGTALTDNSATFTQAMVGMSFTGSGAPAGTTLAAFIDSHHMTLSQACTNGAITYTLGFTDAMWEPYRRAIYEVGRDNGYAVWDMYARTGGWLGSDPDALSSDKLHPSPKGAQVIATEMVRLFTGVPDQFAVWRGDFNAAGQQLYGTADNAYAALLPSTYYGDGSDGVVNMDGTNTYAGFATKASNDYTLTRDVLATSFTVTGATTRVFTNGFRILSTLGVTVATSGAQIIHPGGAGGAGAAGAGAGTAGAAAAAGSMLGGGAGVIGGAGTANTSGGTAPALSNGIGGTGGNGGKGTGTGVQANTGAATPPAASAGAYQTAGCALTNRTLSQTQFAGGRGGSSGTGNLNGGGGGGGGGGGIILIAAPIITVVAGGIIAADGGVGGNGGGANIGGSGGGGGGGAVFLITPTLTNAGTIRAAGGAPGTGGVVTVATAGAAGIVKQLIP